eukprot:CAMPEP_0185846144 /NCGR_PEP_ID=MMETSP1354-20130828/1877_1 /TAXON_ID=708628 /ORGANISM="Erythrolobus madagascarensis, Strain CCMP3276" /LENGTH=334 /DNA_ID=CAMNT_0028546233 /DNA_START=59 /DNA_END=1063 /DNA_ORIENTATION=-
MKAVVQTEYGNPDVMKITDDAAKPVVGEYDVLVKNSATGVNPIDFKIRSGGVKVVEPSESAPLVVGWDGAGVVVETGAKVDTGKIKAGDEVYYAGVVNRAGSYAEYTAVDSRIVALKPKSASFAEAATIPLVAITAAEALIDSFKAKEGQSILIFNGAGGVGSFTIQLAKCLGLTVIATASRAETIAFVKELGADHIINHHEPLVPQLEAVGVPAVDFAFDLFDNKKLPELLTTLKPGGSVAVTWILDKELAGAIDWFGMLSKRQSLHSVFMFSRAMYAYEQERISEHLERVAKLVDDGKIKPVVKHEFKLEDIAKAHELQESGKVMGKITVTI